MLRYAVISLIIILCAIGIITLGKIISVALISVAKIALWIFVPAFVVFIVIDILLKKSKKKSEKN
ncbi:MAG: hypothetical protein AB7V32_06660 [Candidatus Berkiella sp.]